MGSILSYCKYFLRYEYLTKWIFRNNPSKSQLNWKEPTKLLYFSNCPSNFPWVNQLGIFVYLDNIHPHFILWPCQVNPRFINWQVESLLSRYMSNGPHILMRFSLKKKMENFHAALSSLSSLLFSVLLFPLLPKPHLPSSKQDPLLLVVRSSSDHTLPLTRSTPSISHLLRVVNKFPNSFAT